MKQRLLICVRNRLLSRELHETVYSTPWLKSKRPGLSWRKNGINCLNLRERRVLRTPISILKRLRHRKTSQQWMRKQSE